jgi:acetate kinase
MATLVINAGSSSLKFALFSPDQADASASGLVDWKADGPVRCRQRPSAGPADAARAGGHP